VTRAQAKLKEAKEVVQTKGSSDIPLGENCLICLTEQEANANRVQIALENVDEKIDVSLKADKVVLW
jgi:hypothetical protein